MRSSVNLEETRTIEVTCKQINKYKFGLVEIIDDHKKLLKDKNISDEVKEVYQSIVKDYQKELDYLNKIFWEV